VPSAYENNTKEIAVIDSSVDPTTDIGFIDPVFEHYTSVAIDMSLYLGIFNSESLAAAAAVTPEEGHLYYDSSMGVFRLYHDDAWISQGSSSSSEFSPGYAYVFVDANTFQVHGLNVVNLFNVSRRLKFIVDGAYIYGEIEAVDYNATSLGNTTITMTMEGGGVLTSGLTELSLVSGVTGWSPVLDSKFNGVHINDITCGTVAGIKTWVAAGDYGAVSFSTDKGLNWSAGVSGTGENLLCIAYDPLNEIFAVGGENGVYRYSADGGATWLAYTSAGSNRSAGAIQNLIAGESGYFAIPVGIGAVQQVLSDNSGSWVYSTAMDLNESNAFFRTIDGYYTAPYAAVGNTFSNKYCPAWGNNDSNYNTGLDYTPVNKSFQVERSGLAVVADNSVLYFSTHENGDNNTAWSVKDPGFDTSNILDGHYSESLLTSVVVGANGKLSFSNDNCETWQMASTGFGMNNINCVHYDEGDRIFIACGSNGVICRSTNGVK